jgi:hypothetical protein
MLVRTCAIEHSLQLPPSSNSAPHVSAHFASGVASTLFCARCAYDLRATDENASCPECGVPVQITKRYFNLRSLDAASLVLLRRGLQRIVYGGIGLLSLGAMLFVVFIVLVVTPLLRPLSPPGSLASLFGLLPLAIGLVFVASQLYGCLGYCDVARAAPLNRLLDERYKHTDLLIQLSRIGIFLCVVAATCGIAGALLGIVQTSNGSLSVDLSLAGVYLAIASLLVAYIRFLPASLLLAKLAVRLPDPSLVAHARRMLWLGPLLVVFGVPLTCTFVLGAPFLLAAFLLHFYGFWRLRRLLRPELVARQ